MFNLDQQAPSWLPQPKSSIFEYQSFDNKIDDFFRIKKTQIQSNQLSMQEFISCVNTYGKMASRYDDEEIKTKIQNLSVQLRQQGLKKNIVSKMFALIRELSDRIMGMRHYDVQLMGGWTICQGMIAEMQTGEGKTLTATLPASTLALAGLPVHVITVNEYLAQRDAQTMRPLYEALGLTVSSIRDDMDPVQRRSAYQANITYCTNKQIAFDYLRDQIELEFKRSPIKSQLKNINTDKQEQNQLLLPGLYFAIIDEADSVLIDEAKTPLIISREVTNTSEVKTYIEALRIAKKLVEGQDFSINQKKHEVILTEQGAQKCEKLCDNLDGLWKGKRRREFLIINALCAYHIFKKDQQYIVKDKKVHIIDENTGRLMSDRSWEMGLHQMIECKEGCPISGLKETLARLTYQRFFRRYHLLSGMSGTVKEVRKELRSVYGLNILSIPKNKTSKRVSVSETIYLQDKDKWDALITKVKNLHDIGRPILIGTRTVEESEAVSKLLADNYLPHNVLNAKQDAHESAIIALAGRKKTITVATNMAGRGTDIKIPLEVVKLGGLHVISTEVNDSRRIDRQLYGRCARQDDPGSFEAILSLDDPILKTQYQSYTLSFLKKLFIANHQVPEKIGLYLLSHAQNKIEKKNQEMRYDLLKYDEYLNHLLAFTGPLE